MVEKLNPKDFTTLKDKNISLFDIYFRDSKTKKKIGLPVGQYTVVMPKEKGKVVEKVYYVNDNGQVEEKTFTQNEKSIIFKTGHFSMYAVEYKKGNNEKDKIIDKDKVIDKNKTNKKYLELIKLKRI